MGGDSGGKTGLTYADAGVDIAAGDAVVDAIKPHAASTMRPGADVMLAGFGGAFDLKAAGYADPILVAGTDGVGTKLEIACAVGRHHEVGIDLVAMCVNDILVQGAEPLFFLDYVATGVLDPAATAAFVGGVADGCRQSGCALIGGETAEMPGLYRPGTYDAAGFVVGAAERGALLPDHASMAAGDALVAVGSDGLHSNGFSLVRKVVERAGLAWDSPAPFAPSRTLGDALLDPTRLYVSALLPLLRDGSVRGAAHITGGGLIENPPRMTPQGLVPVLDWATWTPQPVFAWLQETGAIADAEMRRTFNMGAGLVLAVAPVRVEDVIARLEAAGERAWVCGALREAA